jgi:hypothetical protein
MTPRAPLRAPSSTASSRAMPGKTSTRPNARASSRARASPVARRWRRVARVAAYDASSSVPPPSPTPTEIASAANASETSQTSSLTVSASADARPNAETLVDAFESLPKEERVRLVERYVFGVGSETVAPDVKMDERVDVDIVGAAELTEEELADLRDFGPPPPTGSVGADAFQSEDALVDKWREVFGEDPPENGGGSVEDILGPEPQGIGAVVGGVKDAVSSKLYAVERARDKLTYRFGRVGAVIASGLASVGVAFVMTSLLPKSQGATDEVYPIDRVASAAGRKDAEQTADAKDTIPEMESSKAPSSTNGVLWERKTSVKEDVPDSAPSPTNGVLWTRKGDKEGRKSARDRMGPPASGTFDDRGRGDESAPQVLWTRKNDPESSEMTVDSPKARPHRRMRVAGSPLDDNLEDLRAFRRQDSERDSPR